jgi:nucleoside-diphosphate-sugar epimerase
MTAGRKTVAVTGANGFVGRHLCHHFLARGFDVRGLVRDPRRRGSLHPDVALFRCVLPAPLDSDAFRNVDVLIHCAYTSRFRSLAEARRVNEEGTARVRALCFEAGVRQFVFVSSTSAHDQALSYYGKSKRMLERTLDAERDLIIRPGLVLGNDGGLFCRLVSSLRRSGFVPVFGGGRQTVQTVHVDDLCCAFDRAIEQGLTGTFVVAEPGGLPLRDLFRLVAAKIGCRATIVPLPAGPALALLRAAEALRLPLPISSENVLGALALRSQPSSADLDAIGVVLRPASESLGDLLAASSTDDSSS